MYLLQKIVNVVLCTVKSIRLSDIFLSLNETCNTVISNYLVVKQQVVKLVLSAIYLNLSKCYTTKIGFILVPETLMGRPTGSRSGDPKGYLEYRFTTIPVISYRTSLRENPEWPSNTRSPLHVYIIQLCELWLYQNLLFTTYP